MNKLFKRPDRVISIGMCALCVPIILGTILICGCIGKTADERIAQADAFIESAEADEFRLSAEDDGWIFFYAGEQYNSLYEGVHLIDDDTSTQWEWLHTHFWKFNADGIGEWADEDGVVRTMVALAPEFGNIGDCVDLMFTDETVMHCVIVDVKSDAEQYGHRHGDLLNVIEILVSEEWYENSYENKLYGNVIAYKKGATE